ncbi:MAG: hypothetical protein WCE49_11020, partial [Terrimicrobiaceae bacterium]
MKITVIGIDKVGSTVAFVLACDACDGIADEIVLRNRTKASPRRTPLTSSRPALSGRTMSPCG